MTKIKFTELQKWYKEIAGSFEWIDTYCGSDSISDSPSNFENDAITILEKLEEELEEAEYYMSKRNRKKIYKEILVESKRIHELMDSDEKEKKVRENCEKEDYEEWLKK